MNMRSTIWLAALALLGGCGGGAANNTMGAGDSVALNQAELDELVPCRAVEQRVSRAECEDLTRAIEEVRLGAAAFNAPNPMRRDETVSVHLVVDRRRLEVIREIETSGDPTQNVSDPTQNAMDPSENVMEPVSNQAESWNGEGNPTPGQVVDALPGTTVRYAPPVGRHMRAELVGQGFTIVPRTPASQEIPPGGQMTWTWDVTALEGGAKSLTLTTVVEGVVRNGRRIPLAPTQRIHNITVEVSWSGQIRDWLKALPDWLKLIAAVLTALGTLAGAWFALRAKFKRTPEPERKANPGGG